MLSEAQIKRVWDNMLAAETRALYFGDLASRYTRQKQWIAGISFFLSSGGLPLASSAKLRRGFLWCLH